MKDDILDAAARVVTKLGACGLSIDAVARDAGISKSTVLYEHKSKSALLRAMIDRQTSSEKERIRKAVKASENTPHPALFGRVSVARCTCNDADKAVTLTLCASASSHEELMQNLRDLIAADLKAMSGTTEAALMAYLALTGFRFIELLGLHSWSAAERGKILDGVGAIYTDHLDRK